MTVSQVNNEEGRILHDFRQPLNVIGLTSANLRARLLPVLDEAMATYLCSKLDRIDKQAELLSQLVDSLAEPPGTPD